jgi:Uma2 family endonuclease
MNWRQACEDKSLANLPFKIELNRHGQILMSPTRNKHGFYQAQIAHLLKTLLPQGFVLTECAIDTAEGTFVADVTWASADRFETIEEEFSCSIAPEVCVEIWSESNSAEEIGHKREIYFAKGAVEFWYCDKDGRMTFFTPDSPLPASRICPGFPQRVSR